LHKGASLLPTGIKSVQYEFQQGDSVNLIDDKSKKIIAKGITLYSQHELKRIMGQHSDNIDSILGHDQGDVVVHRDDMVIV
jgi:glutamate 5-kinase